MNMKAVIYTRVSTLEQAESNKSLDTQEKDCRSFAARKNIDVEKVFEERGESAKTADRTELKALLRFCSDKNNGVTDVNSTDCPERPKTI
jgi:site-specific DNA recombinase